MESGEAKPMEIRVKLLLIFESFLVAMVDKIVGKSNEKELEFTTENTFLLKIFIFKVKYFIFSF